MFRRLNEWLATKTVATVATMECAYAFAVLALLPLIKPDWETVIAFISSSVLQLILLPLIMVGQDVSERRQRAQADQDHAAVLEILATIRQDHASLAELVAELHAHHLPDPVKPREQPNAGPDHRALRRQDWQHEIQTLRQHHLKRHKPAKLVGGD